MGRDITEDGGGPEGAEGADDEDELDARRLELEERAAEQRESTGGGAEPRDGPGQQRARDEERVEEGYLMRR